MHTNLPKVAIGNMSLCDVAHKICTVWVLHLETQYTTKMFI